MEPETRVGIRIAITAVDDQTVMSSHSPRSNRTDPTAINEHWAAISQHVLNSYVEANNAVLAAMGLSPADERSSTDYECVNDRETTTDAAVSSVAFADETWSMDRSVSTIDAIDIGEFVEFTKPIAERDVSAFAQVSGDTNRLHLEPEFARETRFGERIVHGTLVAGTISAALARFPGNTVYLSQDLEFLAPVAIGDTVVATCEVVELLGNDQYRIRTTVATEDGDTVIDGEAVVLITESPTEQR